MSFLRPSSLWTLLCMAGLLFNLPGTALSGNEKKPPVTVDIYYTADNWGYLEPCST